MPKTSKHKIQLPQDLDALRARAMRAMQPIKPGDMDLPRSVEHWVQARRTNAGRALPPYYLVYFVFVDLLAFPYIGPFEKEAWSVPIDFNGKTYVIKHAKMGLGVFVPNPSEEEEAARRIVDLVRRGVAAAEPFFEWRASEAVQASQLNVVNHSGWLYERYQFLRQRFDAASSEAEARKEEHHVTTEKVGESIVSMTGWSPYWGLTRNARWLGLAAIDAFFSWTEHVFIHLAILQGRLTTGEQIAEIADADWQDKFKAALDLDAIAKGHFDKLVVIRRQLRNFMAHGAFGKNGEAFRFHSGAGAVPVLLTHRPGKGRFSLSGEREFDESGALKVIDEFVEHLWSGSREPARIYLIDDTTIPTILPYASDGTYAAAMQSVEAMRDFVDAMTRTFDNAANMD
jgi:hypothetical protein